MVVPSGGSWGILPRVPHSWTFPYVLAQQDIPASSRTFPARPWHQPCSEEPCFLSWRTARRSPGAGVRCAQACLHTRTDTCPLHGEHLTHTYTCTFLSRLSITGSDTGISDFSSSTTGSIFLLSRPTPVTPFSHVTIWASLSFIHRVWQKEGLLECGW